MGSFKENINTKRSLEHVDQLPEILCEISQCCLQKGVSGRRFGKRPNTQLLEVQITDNGCFEQRFLQEVAQEGTSQSD